MDAKKIRLISLPRIKDNFFNKCPYEDGKSRRKIAAILIKDYRS